MRAHKPYSYGARAAGPHTQPYPTTSWNVLLAGNPDTCHPAVHVLDPHARGQSVLRHPGHKARSLSHPWHTRSPPSFLPRPVYIPAGTPRTPLSCEFFDIGIESALPPALHPHRPHTPTPHDPTAFQPPYAPYPHLHLARFSGGWYLRPPTPLPPSPPAASPRASRGRLRPRR